MKGYGIYSAHFKLFPFFLRRFRLFVEISGFCSKTFDHSFIFVYLRFIWKYVRCSCNLLLFFYSTIQIIYKYSVCCFVLSFCFMFVSNLDVSTYMVVIVTYRNTRIDFPSRTW